MKNLVKDLCLNLDIGSIIADIKPQPPQPPIVYLTAWRLVGNSEVHTDEYITQWKVEGNSVVDNNTILSCGDLGQDGKYHVKISNGVTIYDVALDEPLRKAGSVADTIEFADGVAVVTRNLDSVIMSSLTWGKAKQSTTGRYRYSSSSLRDIAKPSVSDGAKANILCTIYETITANQAYGTLNTGISVSTAGIIYLYDENYNTADDFSAFKAHINGAELIYELATPTTETIQVSPFPISPTDTYTSVNDTPYSAFEYKKNVEIWSCGEYSAVDGKYHILVQPLGGSITDIALDEPLRKVNDIADSIEFADDVATLTRAFGSVNMGDKPWGTSATNVTGKYRCTSSSLSTVIKCPSSNVRSANVLIASYDTISLSDILNLAEGIGVSIAGIISVYDEDYNQSDSAEAFKTAMNGVELIYELATPTTETIQVPQIEEADSYSCVISQGAKAVEWTEFVVNPS